MQSNGRVQTPPLSHYAQASHQNHAYTSSSESSYGQLQSHSRSESGTSQTNYDDALATPPPPRTLIPVHNRSLSHSESHIGGPQRKSSASARSMETHQTDPMTMHLLLEDALDDSLQFAMLSPHELKALKKEQIFLSRRMESAEKRLLLERRVLDSAQSLHRLESRSQSKYNPPSSLGKRRTSGGSETVDLPSLDTRAASRKCDELAQNIRKIERRRAELHERRLKHSAGVLMIYYQSQSQNTQSQRSIDADDIDDEDPENEPQLKLMDDATERDTPQNLKPRLQALSAELYGLISRSGPYSKAGYAEPPNASAIADDELTYVEMGLNTVKGLHEGLVSYSEQSIEKARRYEQMNSIVTGLWDVVGPTENDLKRSNVATRNLSGRERGLEDDDSSDDESDDDDQFSIHAFSSRVQRLCDRATAMSEEHQAMHQDLAFSKQQRALAESEQLISEREARQVAEANLLLETQVKSEEIQTIRGQLVEHETTVEMLNDVQDRLAMAEVQAQAHETDRQAMETELVRLQTELTVARAELDGAYGTRAQRALEGQSHPETQKDLEELITKNTDLMEENAEIEQRVELLQKELRELVTEYEGLVKQSIEAEKDRESLEGLVDSLKERIEEAEVKLNDEKVKSMGKRSRKAVNGEIGRGSEMTSLGTMKGEFKKMMRDARAEHFRSLKAEQEERRRLEAIIRNLRKEQTAAYSSTLSPPHTIGKSGLSKSVPLS